MVKSKTYIASPPGAIIKEHLSERGMTQKEFAQRMGLSEKHISNLINGDVQLTPDVAMRLELVLGLPSKFWNNLEAIYRDKLIKANAENEMEADIELAKKFPYKEMARNGWVSEVKDIYDKILELRKFFEVVRLNLVETTIIPGVACRRMASHEKADFALYPWAQKARIEARKISTQPINLANLSEVSLIIRGMTRDNPQDFCISLKRLLAESGIAIVFLPHIGGSFLHGATFYDGKKIVMGLTVRGKFADRFWFSFFHEIGHIMHGHIGQVNGTSDSDEKDADDFAKNILIPPLDYDFFIDNQNFSKSAILDFSNKIELHPGIIVGRLQKEGHIPYNTYNDLKIKYEINL